MITKDTLFYKIKDICEYLETRAADLSDQQIEVIKRDFDTTLKSLEPQDSQDVAKDEYVSVILEAHMDTICKTILNIIVLAITELALEEKGESVQMPDPVEYMLANKEYYMLEDIDNDINTIVE